MKQLSKTVELKTLFSTMLQISACMSVLPLADVKKIFHLKCLCDTQIKLP